MAESRPTHPTDFIRPLPWIRSLTGDGLPEGPGRFPYMDLGRFRKFQRNPIWTVMEYVREYGPVFTQRIMAFKVVMVVGAEANQRILVENDADFSWGKGLMGEFIPFLGHGLLTTDDEEHDRARRLMEPMFRPDRLRIYAERMVDLAVEEVERLEPGDEIDLYDWTRDLALRIATRILLGMGASREVCARLSEKFEEGLSLYGYPLPVQSMEGPWTPFARMRRARKTFDRLLYEEIERRRREGPSDDREDNILDLLLEAGEGGEGFTDEEIRDQVMTLLFAGHDTTTDTVAWMFSLLGQHHDPYRKLRAEVRDELEEGDADPDDLMDGLPYLTQVMDETLRLYPPAWFGPRLTLNEVEIAGHTIPAGTHVAYCSLATHRLPELFEDPEMFDPSRMTPRRKRERPPGAYVPFGRGPRTCIGMNFGKLEIKAIVSALLRRFHLELVPGQKFTARTLPTLSPRHGVTVTVRPRTERPGVRDGSRASSGDQACPVDPEDH